MTCTAAPPYRRQDVAAGEELAARRGAVRRASVKQFASCAADALSIAAATADLTIEATSL